MNERFQEILDGKAAAEIERRGIQLPTPIPQEVRDAEVAADEAIRQLLLAVVTARLPEDYIAARLAGWVAEAERVAKLPKRTAEEMLEDVRSQTRTT